MNLELIKDLGRILLSPRRETVAYIFRTDRSGEPLFPSEWVTAFLGRTYMLTESVKQKHAFPNVTEQVESLTDMLGQLAGAELDSANAPRAWSKQFTKLSVIVPLYNERWTINSMLARLLCVQLDLDIEVVIVDDGSTDGSVEVVKKLSEDDPRIRLIQHDSNRGKGAAIRTAVQHITGQIAIIQDADLEYDPHDFPRLLAPILSGHADAVFGSRFAGSERRVLLFWHSLGNKLLTLICNAINDLNLTDMETCYKAMRSDILRQLKLSSNTFTIEPELTTRLSQWGGRIYEVPISYRGRTRQEGKKIRPIDGIKAIWQMIYSRFIDTQFTHHAGMFVLRSVENAVNYNSWLIEQVKPYLGQRLVEAGAGIGNLSQLLTDRKHLLLIDHDPVYVARLAERFQQRVNIQVQQCDLTQPNFEEAWQEERLDTVFCSNVLEHLGPDGEIVKSFYNALSPEGHCVLIVPAERALYNRLDASLGHYRRYGESDLRALMENAGFEVVFSQQFCKIGSLAWWINGRLMGRNGITPAQMLQFDRLWPIVGRFDRFLPWRGMSLIMVGKKA